MNIVKSFFTTYQEQVVDWQSQFHFVQAISVGFKLSKNDLIEELPLEKHLKKYLSGEPIDECFPKQSAEIILLSTKEEPISVQIGQKQIEFDITNFGLRSKSDKQRKKQFGKINQDYLTHTFPALPDSCDKEYFQRAMTHQQITSSFVAGEKWQINESTGLIPQIQLRVFHIMNKQWEELKPIADTLLLVPEKDIAVITFRAITPVKQFDAAEVDGCLIAIDDPENWRSTEHFKQSYQNRIGPQRSHFALKTDDLLPINSTNLNDEIPNQLAKIDSEAQSVQQFTEQIRQLIMPEHPPQANINQRLQQPSQIFDSVDFTAQKFEQHNWKGHQFHDCIFKQCQFDQIHVEGCHFINCDFSNAQFIDTLLQQLTVRGNQFYQSRWQQCTVDRCIYKDNELAQSRLEQCHFYDCHFTQVNWHKAWLKQCHLLQNSHKACLFTKFNAHQCQFHSSTFRSCLFDDSKLAANQFGQSQFISCQLQGSDVTESDFTQSQFQDTRFDENMSQHVTFSQTKWKDCQLYQNDFSSTQWIGSEWIGSTIESNQFDKANMLYLTNTNSHWQNNQVDKTVLAFKNQENSYAK